MGKRERFSYSLVLITIFWIAFKYYSNITGLLPSTFHIQILYTLTYYETFQSSNLIGPGCFPTGRHFTICIASFVCVHTIRNCNMRFWGDRQRGRYFVLQTESILCDLQRGCFKLMAARVCSCSDDSSKWVFRNLACSFHTVLFILPTLLYEGSPT